MASLSLRGLVAVLLFLSVASVRSEAVRPQVLPTFAHVNVIDDAAAASVDDDREARVSLPQDLSREALANPLETLRHDALPQLFRAREELAAKVEVARARVEGQLSAAESSFTRLADDAARKVGRTGRADKSGKFTARARFPELDRPAVDPTEPLRVDGDDADAATARPVAESSMWRSFAQRLRLPVRAERAVDAAAAEPERRHHQRHHEGAGEGRRHRHHEGEGEGRRHRHREHARHERDAEGGVAAAAQSLSTFASSSFEDAEPALRRAAAALAAARANNAQDALDASASTASSSLFVGAGDAADRSAAAAFLPSQGAVASTRVIVVRPLGRHGIGCRYARALGGRYGASHAWHRSHPHLGFGAGRGPRHGALGPVLAIAAAIFVVLRLHTRCVERRATAAVHCALAEAGISPRPVASPAAAKGAEGKAVDAEASDI